MEHILTQVKQYDVQLGEDLLLIDQFVLLWTNFLATKRWQKSAKASEWTVRRKVHYFCPANSSRRRKI